METELLENVIDQATAKANFDQLLDEVADQHIAKVIMRGDEPSAILLSLTDFRDMQERLLAVELQQAYKETKAEYENGDFTTLEDLATEFHVTLAK